jgi:membrane-bound lytic murein transglycosylase B
LRIYGIVDLLIYTLWRKIIQTLQTQDDTSMLRIATLPFSLMAAIFLFVMTTPVQSQNHEPIASLELSDAEPDNLPESLSSLIRHFDNQGVDLKSLLDDPRFELYEGITERFTRSAERRTPTFEDYKRILGFDAKKRNIKGFIDSNKDQLKKAEEEYGIPRYVIAAIIGVESDFGQNIGSFNPLNAYVSMYAENYRSEFARAQLEELLKFTTRKDIDVFELKSSYAGAMSFAQFIPYSINRWWVGDDIFDMNNNILSVANYLAHFKGVTGSLERAVFRYNPSQLYTDAVLALADEAEKMYQ